MSNLGLDCLHTAKIATYFKGLQVHSVLVLEYVTLETCMHSDVVRLQAYIIYRLHLGPYFRYMSCNGSSETA